MWELQRRKKIRMYLYSKGAILILLIVTVFIAKATWNVYEKNRESARAAAIVESEAAALRAREDVLSKENELLATPEGQEREIRSKYSVAKKDEETYIIVEDKDMPEGAGQSEAGWWSRVGSFFGKGPATDTAPDETERSTQ